MRPTQSLVRLALCLSSVSPLVSAWPGWLPDVDTLVVRADETESDTKATGMYSFGRSRCFPNT